MEHDTRVVRTNALHQKTGTFRIPVGDRYRCRTSCAESGDGCPCSATGSNDQNMCPPWVKVKITPQGDEKTSGVRIVADELVSLSLDRVYGADQGGFRVYFIKQGNNGSLVGNGDIEAGRIQIAQSCNGIGKVFRHNGEGYEYEVKPCRFQGGVLHEWRQ